MAESVSFPKVGDRLPGVSRAGDRKRKGIGAGWRPAIGRLQELDRLASASRLRGREGVGQVQNQRRYL